VNCHTNYNSDSRYAGDQIGGVYKLVKISTTILTLVFGLCSASFLRADVLPFTWSTTGSFSPAGGLSFTGVSAGSAQYTSQAGNLSNIDLGTISFPNPSGDFSGIFSLKVNFLRPDGAQDPQFAAPFVVDANYQGNQDSLTINFPSTSTVSFSGTDGTGNFMFTIPDLSVTRAGNPTATYELYGNITSAHLTSQAAVPEPGSIVLFATVLVGVGLATKKRLQGGFSQ